MRKYRVKIHTTSRDLADVKPGDRFDAKLIVQSIESELIDVATYGEESRVLEGERTLRLSIVSLNESS